jgi:hypothetical protein
MKTLLTLIRYPANSALGGWGPPFLDGNGQRLPARAGPTRRGFPRIRSDLSGAGGSHLNVQKSEDSLARIRRPDGVRCSVRKRRFRHLVVVAHVHGKQPDVNYYAVANRPSGSASTAGCHHD